MAGDAPGGLGLSAAGLDQLLSALTAVDPHKLLPEVKLYFHLSEEAIRGQHSVVRSEHAGPLPLRQLIDFLRHVTTKISVTPVIDRRTVPSVHAYEMPDRLREYVTITDPVEVFPYGTTRSRSCDLDHTESWQAARDGPPQTSPENLGPLGRSHHRRKTHAGWQHVQVREGAHWWRTPNQYVFSCVDGITASARRGPVRPVHLDQRDRPDT